MRPSKLTDHPKLVYCNMYGSDDISSIMGPLSDLTNHPIIFYCMSINGIVDMVDSIIGFHCLCNVYTVK